jgi:hypothetical protein
MIPFGSQRALGQDLATHLLNAQDNERLEVAQVRGAVARDLHGAFAEWEAQAYNLTRATNYLYSLSINPDQRQGRLTREQYFDYIDRTEQRLGLSGQPRAVVFHIKKDRHGIPREHCHVVWSRTDVERKIARHMAFDHDKLMMVTREYARDHGLKLPDGYNKEVVRARRGRGCQMGLYDKRMEELGSLSLEQHKAQVTAAWDRRDTARSFVRELEDMGYILATGNRDYVLVDLYGAKRTLPRLIDDKKVRIAQVREFLGKDFPKDSLPSVEEARGLAAAHRAALELFEQNERRAVREAREKQRREELQVRQQPRRQEVEQDEKALSERQRQARQEFFARQWGERAALRQGYLQESRRIKTERAAHRPTGLAAFLGRITGVELITKKVQQYRDRTRYTAHVTRLRDMTEHQKREAKEFERRQALERLAIERRLKALELVEQRERKSLEVALIKERRIEDRERQEGSRTPQEPARKRSDEFNEAATRQPEPKKEAERGKETDEGSGESTAGSAQEVAPEAEITIQRRKRVRDEEQDRTLTNRRSDLEHDGDDQSPDRPQRRRRDRDFGPDR